MDERMEIQNSKLSAPPPFRVSIVPRTTPSSSCIFLIIFTSPHLFPSQSSEGQGAGRIDGHQVNSETRHYRIFPKQRSRMLSQKLTSGSAFKQPRIFPVKLKIQNCNIRSSVVNLLTPNVNYSGRTAPLTSKVAFYIFIQQI